jgi:hypothetical protein
MAWLASTLKCSSVYLAQFYFNWDSKGQVSKYTHPAGTALQGLGGLAVKLDSHGSQ